MLDRAQRHASWLVIGSLIFGLWAASHVYYYNVLLGMEAHVTTTKAQIVVAEEHRDHLRRSLTQLLRFHASYERDVLKELTTLRGPSSRPEKAEGLARLDAVGEQYPNLQLNMTVKQVSDSLVNAEVEITKRIYEYNSAVNMYTLYLHQFPGNVFGRPLGFHDHEYYKPSDPSVTEYQEVNP
jgi:hypothetical protein